MSLRNHLRCISGDMYILWIYLCLAFNTFPVFTNAEDYNSSVDAGTHSWVIPCSTPNAERAMCIPIDNCTILLSQINNTKAHAFLKKSKCQTHDAPNNPRVCCGQLNNFRHLVQDDVKPKKCGHQNVVMKSRIVGGRKAILGEFPWMARLIHKDTAGFKVFGCAGSLIAPTFVLTAAHCLKSENVKVLGNIFEVQLGEHNTDTKKDCNEKFTKCAPAPQVIRVRKNIAHPQYSETSRNHHHDLGLIHLRKAAIFTDYVYPICLLEDTDFDPFEYWISGWGSTKTERVSPQKMKLSLPSFPHSTCTEKFEELNVKIIDKQICAGGKKNKDSCTGDSGGPLMIVKDKNTWYAAGVVSYGLACGKEGWPGVYTNITSYKSWIQKQMLKQIKKVNSKGAKIKTKITN